MIIDIIIHGTVRDLARPVAEAVIGRDAGIAGQLRPTLAEEREHVQVLGWHSVIRLGAVRAQEYTRARVIGQEAGNIGMRPPEFRLGARLGLGKRIRASAALCAFRGPFKRIIAVDIQALARGRYGDREPIIVTNQPLGHQVIIGAVLLVHVAATHNTRILVRTLPGSIRVLEAHLEDQPIAVDIFRIEAITLLGIGIEARTAA